MKILKANGAEIPALGLGTWPMKGEECSSIVEEAIAVGYRHIDTAVMYQNDREVGEGIKASGTDRSELFVTTKVWPTDVVDGTFQNTVRTTLDRLQLDHVDLLLIHWPPKVGAVEQWADLLNEAAANGWTKHIGVSNFTSAQLEAMVKASERPIVCNQFENHPYLDQSILRAACAKHGVALIAYCPLFHGGDLFAEKAVVDAASAHGKSPAQVVLRWHMQFDGAGAIPKTATPSRLPENFDVFNFELSDAEMAAISALSARHERICDFEFSPQWDAA
ncbi:aldo/keto reductase [Pseudahrensia aquimaris]|uniref:Aldo/keto reductase n=1 Tax=Pseudahrensia aquimaris TaxID=744461 RepID=A0ABW3FJ55_9HYPH